MKKFIPLIIGLAASISLKCQVITPGGVKGVSQWYIADPKGSPPSFRNNIPSNTTLSSLLYSSSISWLNNNPSLVFSGKTKFSITMKRSDFSGGSYFTVYQALNVSSENIVWFLSNENKTNLVLTTTRMADLAESKYINFIDKFPLNPKVNTYVHYREKDSVPYLPKTLNVGYKPAFPELPITSFKGLIPEIIIYDSALNWKDQIRVASYLALKYGITLAEPVGSYLNSSGEKIWDGESYAKYHNNIAGIARDDSSGLFQNRSASSNNPNLLTIMANDSIHNNSFLLWGDNNMPFSLLEKTPGIPSILQKKWLIVAHGIIDSISTNVIVDTKQIDAILPPMPVYWLAIDRTDKGDFSQPGTEFIKMNQLDAKGYVHFNKVEWNKAGNDKAVFGFIVDQELLLSSIIKSPTCNNPLSGNLEIKVWGGKPPFKLKIVKNGALLSSYQLNDQTLNVPGIAAGKYTIEVTDALQHIYRDTYYINNEDAIHPQNILEKYVLEDGRILQIDASLRMPEALTYYWEGPNNFKSFSPKIVIKESGIYTLTSSKDGCSFIQNISVSRPPKGAFNIIKIYPNPSAGIFKIKIELDKVAAVVLDIYSEDGKKVASRQLEGFSNYSFIEELNTVGIYYLLFRSGLSSTTKKIIIAK